MENKLNCAIVRDLLPTYVDGIASDETVNAVDRHITSCGDCKEALRLMKEPESSAAKDASEVDDLKKVRRNGRRKSLIVGIVLMLLGLSIFGFRIFYVGHSADASDILFDVSVDGSDMKLTARLASSGLGVSRVTFADSDGMVQVMVYTAPKAFFNHGDFTASYTASSEIGRVRIDDLILWEKGKTISRKAAELFAASNPYIGDMSANARIADVLGIVEQFGPYTNELQTSQEPYGWTFVLNEPVSASVEGTAHDEMIADSCVLLATIHNLGYVTWRYPTNSGMHEFTFTADEACAFSGHNIKSCGDSVTQLQNLTRILDIQ